MTKKEQQETAQQMLQVYSGILFHNQQFEDGNPEEIVYEFDCPEFEELRNQYDLLKIAGKGSDFVRAKRLMHHFAPRLTHCTWYDNHIECNALRLLEYSLDRPEQGINCLNKAKILVECCLAVGIFARRVSLMPCSPYDFDNHVVAEIYDRSLEKWIMLDPTTDGYMIDETKTPLSIIEMRDRFANSEFVTFVRAADRLKDLKKLRAGHVDVNAYLCKNLFYFKVEQVSAFGERNRFLQIAPKNFSIKETRQANLKYRLANLPAAQEALRKKLEERASDLENLQEPEKTNVQSMQKKPI